jgi:ABC-type nitrate/sulfonate/bicarbonate transport system substrate-binding protein
LTSADHQAFNFASQFAGKEGTKMVTTIWLVIFITILPYSLHAQEHYAVSYGGFAGYHAPLWAAKDLGLFAKYGLNADPIMISGSARGMQALIAGSTHFALGDATGPLTAISQGADLILIAGSLNKFPFSMVAQKDIRRPADLIGKKIAISSFGGATEWGVNLTLREWNIPRSSVTLLAQGPGRTASSLSPQKGWRRLFYPHLRRARPRALA